MRQRLLDLFQQTYGRPPEVVARAPGRIEFIGNHTDYNGGTVLGAAIDRDVWVGLASRQDGRRVFHSDLADRRVTLTADALIRQTGPAGWVNYPLGVLAALPAFGLPVVAGFDFAVVSDLPSGAGLSSSAAFELASALVFLAAAGRRDVPPATLAQIGRHAENNFVGVPCGILDQGMAAFGRRDQLVFIDCRGPRFETVPLPADAHFWIFNTHTRHALVDGLYAARHRECLAAAAALGVPLLADVTPARLAAAFASLPPEAGRRAQHVVGEITRVDQTVVALRRGDLTEAGRLLTASHRSSQTLFENSTPALDFLVDTLTARPEVFGARLTGGGFGGAVMALTSPRFDMDAAAAVTAAYAEKFGAAPEVLHLRTGDGATVL
jgi:galactokinase